MQAPQKPLGACYPGCTAFFLPKWKSRPMLSLGRQRAAIHTAFAIRGNCKKPMINISNNSLREGTSRPRTWRQKLCRFLSTTDGATAVEYAVMLALILLSAIAAVELVGENTATSYTDSASSIESAMNGGS